MTLGEDLVGAWRQSMVEDRTDVQVGGQTFRVERTRRQGLRTIALSLQGVLIEGIEQNPETRSRWAKLAQEGQRIMQFRVRGRYIGNVCEGQLMRYPSWKSLGLPE